MTDYTQTSFWLESALDALTPRPSLKGGLTVDVAILGGGFSGLWTAYYLLRDNPGIEVAVVEREICGFGASGRNGGWCSARFPIEADALTARVGPTRARETILALCATVEEIGQVVAAEGIDADYRRTGLLNLARGETQLASLAAAQRAYERLGLGSQNRLLGAQAAHELVHATNVSGGLLAPLSASLHPGKLVRGLARTVERYGGVIYEQSAVKQLETGARARLVTDAGHISARRAVVAAGEAYLAGLPPFGRTLLPVTSSIILTAPLTPQQWTEIGWQGGQSVSSQSLSKNYLTRTADGRILYGSRGVPYQYGSRISDAALRDDAVYSGMHRKLVEWFPILSQVEITHSWGGFLGIPRDWMPTVHFDESIKLARLYGYTGRGVSTTNLTARLLSGLITGRPSGLEALPLHRPAIRHWEFEPLRWLATRYVQEAFQRIDEAEDSGRPGPWDDRLARYLGSP